MPGLNCSAGRLSKVMRFSRLAKAIYTNYTDRVEAFGFDECWLDITGTEQLFGDGETVANKSF